MKKIKLESQDEVSRETQALAEHGPYKPLNDVFAGRSEHLYSRNFSAQRAEAPQRGQVRPCLGSVSSPCPTSSLTTPCHCRLVEVIHAEHRLWLIFEFLEWDLKKYMDLKDLTPVLVKVTCGATPFLGTVWDAISTCYLDPYIVELHVPALQRHCFLPRPPHPAP